MRENHSARQFASCFGWEAKHYRDLREMAHKMELPADLASPWKQLQIKASKPLAFCIDMPVYYSRCEDVHYFWAFKC